MKKLEDTCGNNVCNYHGACDFKVGDYCPLYVHDSVNEKKEMDDLETKEVPECFDCMNRELLVRAAKRLCWLLCSRLNVPELHIPATTIKPDGMLLTTDDMVVTEISYSFQTNHLYYTSGEDAMWRENERFHILTDYNLMLEYVLDYVENNK